jgi:hypothetical protein
VRGQRHAPAAFYPQERPGTLCTGGRVGPRTGLDRCEKAHPPPGFNSQIIQPIARHYTNWVTRPTEDTLSELKINPAVKKIQNYRNKCMQNVWWRDRDILQDLIMKYQPCGKWNQVLPFNKRLSDLVGQEKVRRPKTLWDIWLWT